MRRSKVLQIHFSEGQQWEGKPLYEEIVRTCREMSIAGATVFRGVEGFGETAEIHRRHMIAHDQPIIVVVVDEEERIEALVPAVERMMSTGLMALGDVDAIRVCK